MTVSANQPYFLPYLPYWQLIAASDMFLVGDDYSFRKSSWINRNTIINNGRRQWLRVELDHQSSFKNIGDTRILLPRPSDKLETIRRAYSKAPCFNEGYALLETILGCTETNLSLFLENSIRCVCDYLDIATEIGRTSCLKGNSLLRKEERIYDFCHRLGADTYINATGGQALYDFEAFSRQGIQLRFIKSAHPEPVSILHLVMTLPKDEVRRMLNDYSFIDG